MRTSVHRVVAIPTDVSATLTTTAGHPKITATIGIGVSTDQMLRVRGEPRYFVILNCLRSFQFHVSSMGLVSNLLPNHKWTAKPHLTTTWPGHGVADGGTKTEAGRLCGAPQNNPTMRPSGPTSMASAAGTFGKPGMVMISPQITTTNSAPADSRTSRTLMM